VKALVIGNGESRSWFKPCHQTIMDEEVITWGCNAIYRDGPHCVHNLVAMDYAMQQEIYDSGWALENPEFGDIHNVYFANWNVVPADVADAMLMGYDIPESFIHRSKNKTSQCVISGKDPATLHEKIEAMMKQFPNLDTQDLKLKMEKDVGLWITYVNEVRDDVEPIEGHVGWSTGNTALSLACQSGAEEVYMLGFDLSTYDKPLNNLYKGTDNYLPVSAKGFNPVNWIGQMSEVFDKYKDVTFYWVDCQVSGGHSWHGSSVKDYHSNVRFLTKDELCDNINIL
jgi:hypothetical protein